MPHMRQRAEARWNANRKKRGSKMSEQDELLLTDKEIEEAIRSTERPDGKPILMPDVDKAIAKAQLAKVKQQYEQKYCPYCEKKPDGAMLTMGTRMAHSDCVIQKLNELLDPDYDGVGKPAEIVGFLQKRLDRPAVIPDIERIVKELTSDLLENTNKKVEEAKKQERERIIKEVEKHPLVESSGSKEYVLESRPWWQALKEEK